MSGDFYDGLSLVHVCEPLTRNIKSIRVSQDLFDDLSKSPDDWDIAQRQEITTKPPSYGDANTIINRPFEEADWFNVIGFPFTNWAASRFSDGRFGVWYGSDSVETTVYETAYHWRSGFLADAGFDTLVSHGDRESITGERKVYQVQCDAMLIDLRPRVTEYPALIHPDSYLFTQEVGSRLHHEGYPGLVNYSARCDGTNYGVLNKVVLSNPKACCSLTYRLTRNGVSVEREVGKTWMTLP